jgi:phage shock protein A
MKKKELKNLAKKIADAEYIIQNSDDVKAVAKAQDTILELSGKVSSVEDMLALDDLVQEILNQKS